MSYSIGALHPLVHLNSISDSELSNMKCLTGIVMSFSKHVFQHSLKYLHSSFMLQHRKLCNLRCSGTGTFKTRPKNSTLVSLTVNHLFFPYCMKSGILVSRKAIESELNFVISCNEKIVLLLYFIMTASFVDLFVDMHFVLGLVGIAFFKSIFCL